MLNAFNLNIFIYKLIVHKSIEEKMRMFLDEYFFLKISER